jgi:homoserine kinase
MTRRVRVFSPATLSNLGPGFDVFGLALAEPGDVVEGELSDRPGVEIVEISGDGGALSRDTDRNVTAVAAAHLLDRAAHTSLAARHAGVRLWLRKGIPIASGLGGSAASSVAGAVVVNELLGCPFARGDLVESALAGERLAAVTAHGDNIIPCLLGGIVLVRRLSPLDLVSLPVPRRLHVGVVHPHCQVSTAAARALLDGRQYPLDAATTNTGNAAAFVAALYREDLELLGRSIVDRLVEPVRAPLVPGFHAVKEAAVRAGALGCSISGSGPTMFAFADSEASARNIADAMRSAFAEAAALESDVFVGQVNEAGTVVVSSE